MSAEIIFHPKWNVVQVADFCEAHGLTVQVDFLGKRLRVAAHLKPEVEPVTGFVCERCEWSGPEPEWKSCDAGAPQVPAIEYPVCVACGSAHVTLTLLPGELNPCR